MKTPTAKEYLVSKGVNYIAKYQVRQIPFPRRISGP